MRKLRHKPKSVVILGMGPSIGDFLTETLTQEFSPAYTDEVWTCNMSAMPFHADVAFWMDDLVSQHAFKPGLLEVLKKRKVPVITSRSNRDILPKSYDYPIQEVSKLSFGAFGKPYFNNSIAQMIAYAMYLGVKRIRIFGADFTYPNREYAESGRSCTESWATFASVAGIVVEISKATSLFDSVSEHGIYGYAEQPEINLGGGRKFRYIKATEAEGYGGKYSAYTPEDSSGKGQDAIHTGVPGEDGQPSHDERGRTADSATTGLGAPRVEETATPGPGNGVRDQGAEGRDAPATPAGHVPGGARGRVSKSGDLSRLPEAGK